MTGSGRAAREHEARVRRAAAGAALAVVLAHQDGVVARHQALATGLSASDVDRAVRRREWTRLHPGVYVAHTGTPTWSQRAWAAVLATAPSVLAGTSALRAHEEVARAAGGRRTGPGADADGPIEVAVDVDRHVVAPAGVVLRRRRGLHGRALWEHSPPRLRYDDAIVDLALEAGSDVDALGWFADAVDAGRTRAERLGATLLRRAPRGPRARWLLAALADVAAGTSSVLEHAYVERVVRAHGLPLGLRQARVTEDGRTRYRDVDLPEHRLVVELDGRWHDRSQARRALDLESDLEAAADGDRRTVRLGYVQVHGHPCRTARLLGVLLGRGGWAGRVRACGPGCEAVAASTPAA